jgi:hypothetical protein
MRISVCPKHVTVTTLKAFELSAGLSGGSAGVVFDHPTPGEPKVTFLRVPKNAKKMVVHTMTNPAYVSLFDDQDGNPEVDTNVLVSHNQVITLTAY